MKLSFSAEQFLENFSRYNNDIWPSQALFYLLAAAAVFFSLSNSKASNRIIALILSFFWLWMAFVYHLVYFTAINKGAHLFGAIFIVQGILFAYYGMRDKLSFWFERGWFGITGGILILFALVIYPILGYLNGHIYPAAPTFGLPCPTTIFTFGMLLLSDRKLPIVLLFIPFLWSIIGFTAAFSLGITEDISLLISGIVAVSIIIVRDRKKVMVNVARG